jgi:hypothetical protein
MKKLALYLMIVTFYLCNLSTFSAHSAGLSCPPPDSWLNKMCSMKCNSQHNNKLGTLTITGMYIERCIPGSNGNCVGQIKCFCAKSVGSQSVPLANVTIPCHFRLTTSISNSPCGE